MPAGIIARGAEVHALGRGGGAAMMMKRQDVNVTSGAAGPANPTATYDESQAISTLLSAYNSADTSLWSANSVALQSISDFIANGGIPPGGAAVPTGSSLTSAVAQSSSAVSSRPSLNSTASPTSSSTIQSQPTSSTRPNGGAFGKTSVNAKLVWMTSALLIAAAVCGQV